MRTLLGVGVTVLLLTGCGGGDDRPAASGADNLGSAEAEQARACLSAAGFDVLGGRSSPGDRDAPDVELTFSLEGQQVFIAFYGSDGEAARAEAQVRRSAEELGGSVERSGPVTIVWTAPPPASETRIEDCAFGA